MTGRAVLSVQRCPGVRRFTRRPVGKFMAPAEVGVAGMGRNRGSTKEE
mgnify:CR=1 FL=1